MLDLDSLASLDPEALEILQELSKRGEHEFHAYEPQQGQSLFHQSDKYIRLLFGGNQSGKSRGASQEAAWWFTHKHPYLQLPDRPLKIWVISTEYQTIYEGIYRHLLNIIPEWEIANRGPRIQGHNLHSALFSPRGDEIRFMSAKGAEESRTKFQAAAMDLVVIDEEIENFIWEELQARMISTGGRFVIAATLVESYNWIVDLESRGDAGDDDIFITRLRTDKNPYSNQVQVARLGRIWDEDTKRVRMYGHSARSQGLVYPNFTKQNILKPFDVPAAWPRWHVFDPGFRTSAAIWATITPNNQKIIYREYYKHFAEIHETAKDFRLLERDEIVDFLIIDDKTESRTITGEFGPLTYMSSHFNRYYSPAQKSFHAGVEEFRCWLRPTLLNHSFSYNLDNGSKLELPADCQFFIFNTCINFREEVLGYRFKNVRDRKNSNEPSDRPIKKADHLMDCVRYWSMTKPAYFIRETELDFPLRSESESEYEIPHSTDMVTRIDEHIRRKKEAQNQFVEGQLGW